MIEIKKRNKDILKAAIEKAGGRTKLAEYLGVGISTVQMMCVRINKGGYGIPPRHVLKFEELTGVSRHVMRPDVFGEAK